MIALSVHGGIDTHDVVCLDGKGSFPMSRLFPTSHVHYPCRRSNTVSFTALGKLILSLTKDSYEQLGLTGNPSKFHRDRQRYGMWEPSYPPLSRLF